MENLAAKMFATFMENMKTPCTLIAEDEKGTVLRIGWALKNTRVDMFFDFDTNGKNVQIRGQNFVKFPEEKKELMYQLCNECNSQYRWVKFYVANNDIIAEDDAVIQLDSSSEEVMELMLRMSNIIDEAYGKFMKALWA